MTGRIKVVFASLLKPVDEPRMYDKLARSLAQTYKYDVNIIGFESKNLRKDPLITFWPIFNFKRISLARAFAPLKFLGKLLHLKPELIVLNSPDFLAVSSLYKILFGCSIIYDLQENYYRNIIWSHGSPSLIRRIRAAVIRAKEYVFDRMIIQYILAEFTYLTECSFINKPTLLLQNKARKPEINASFTKQAKSIEAPLQLLYAGTIAESYGILDTLVVADAIYALRKKVTYTICGHCPSAAVFQQLRQAAKERPWIKLLVSQTPIPHQSILEQLAQADFTFVAYRLNPANEGAMPTRIWEALAWRTPMILRKEHPWTSIVSHYNAGFSLDFLNPDPATLKQYIDPSIYYTTELPEDIYWESIEPSWINMVNNFFASKA